MTHTVELYDCIKVMRNLAREVKTRYSVSDNEVIWPYITKDYDITMQYGNLLSNPTEPALVTFPSESYYTWLALKYS
jgi:hypothetical protein